MLPWLLLLTGFGSVPPNPPLVRTWATHFDSEIGHLKVDQGVAYVSTQEWLEAISLATGHRIWKVRNDEIRPPTLVPSGGQVYALCGQEDGQPGWLEARDAASGHLAWRLPSHGKSSTFAVDGDTLFAELEPDKLSAVNLKTHQIRWTRSMVRSLDKFGDPLPDLAASDGTLFVSDEYFDVFAIDESDGKIRWKVHLKHHYDGGDHAVLAPLRSPNDDEIAVGSPDEVRGLDTKTGTEKWIARGYGFGEHLKYSEGVVWTSGYQVFGGIDPKTGLVSWNVPLRNADAGPSPISVSYPTGFVSTFCEIPDGHQILLDATGKVVWSWPQSEPAPVIWFDPQTVVIQEADRLIAYRHGGPSQIVSTSPLQKANRAKQLCDQFEDLSKDEQTELEGLGDAAFPSVLALVTRLDTINGKSDDNITVLQRLQAAEHTLALVSTRRCVPELIKVVDRFPVGSDARSALAEIVVDQAAPEQALQYSLHVLRRAPELGTNRGEIDVALRNVESSTDPRVVRFLIAALKNSKMPTEVREAAYVNLARTGGAAGVRAVLAQRRKLKPLPPLEQRLDLAHLKRVKKGDSSGDGRILDEKRDPSGTLWCLFKSGALGNWEDLWIAKQVNGKWTHPLFTGVCGAYSMFVEPTPPPVTFNGKTRQELIDGAWFTEFVGNPALEKDSDGDGLTDLEEARLGTDPHKADTDGDGLGDQFDPWPTVSRKPKTEAEKIVAAAWEARYHFYDGGVPTPAVLTLPHGMKACEFVGWPGPVVLEHGAAWTQPLTQMYEHGVVFIALAEHKDKGPWEDRVIRWNANRTVATLLISTYSGGLSGDGYTIEVKKFGKEWVVISMGMSYIS